MASFITGLIGGVVIGGAAAIGFAAVNPILPTTDETRVTARVDQGASPKAFDRAASTNAPIATDSAVSRGEGDNSSALATPSSDRAPQIDRITQRPKPVSVAVDDQAASVTQEIAGPELQVPATDEAGPLGQTSLALLTPSAETQPSVSTTAADPVRLAEPDAQAAAPRQTDTTAAAPLDASVTLPKFPSESTLDLATEGANPARPAAPNVGSDAGTARPQTINLQSGAAPSALNQPQFGSFETSGQSLVQGQDSSFVTASTSPARPIQPNVGGLPQIAPNVGDGAPGPSGALLANAATFEGSGKPLLSIVLIDSGPDRMAHDKLQKLLNFPLTIALDADADGARVSGDAFRQSGYDVLALPPVDAARTLTGADNQDQVRNVVNKIFELLPSAVGLIDRLPADLQQDRALANAVVAAMAQGGHGIVSYDVGSNPIPQAAKRAGVFDGKVVRVLDAKSEGEKTIARSLDNAAQTALAEGQAIVVGTTRRETVLSVLNWVFSAQAGSVDLAPVSASLIRASR